MSRDTWSLIKESKRFYVNTYRALVRVLFISAALNLLLGFAIYYSYFSRPENDFYATNAGKPPIELLARSTPNNTSEALLPPDPVDDLQVKALPQ